MPEGSATNSGVDFFSQSADFVDMSHIPNEAFEPKPVFFAVGRHLLSAVGGLLGILPQLYWSQLPSVHHVRRVLLVGLDGNLLGGARCVSEAL